MPGTTAQFVQGQVPRNGEQPGREFCGHLVAVRRFINLHKDVLRDVFCFREVVNRARNEVYDR